MKKSKRRDRVVTRRARVADAITLAGLLRELGYQCSQDLARGKISQLSCTKNDRIFVAVEEKVVTGFVSCHIMPLLHQPGCLCRITALCVLSERRTTGVGKLLMRAVEDFARSTHCVKIEITSGKHRKNTHKFYRRLGYRVVSARFLKEL